MDNFCSFLQRNFKGKCCVKQDKLESDIYKTFSYLSSRIKTNKNKEECSLFDFTDDIFLSSGEIMSSKGSACYHSHTALNTICADL